jgi:hypothetical protein
MTKLLMYGKACIAVRSHSDWRDGVIVRQMVYSLGHSRIGRRRE